VRQRLLIEINELGFILACSGLVQLHLGSTGAAHFR
jgi:hypothetical protein